MPKYAYRCTACAHEFEAVQKFSDDPLKFCPECGAPIHRVIFPAGIVFKGSGWYITDSRKDGGKSDTSTASSKKADTSGDSGSTTADSSAAKKESAPAKAAAD
ncbi:MAG: FmdB family zinc ribbon protein [Thermomicrobiales bacterium]